MGTLFFPVRRRLLYTSADDGADAKSPDDQRPRRATAGLSLDKSISSAFRYMAQISTIVAPTRNGQFHHHTFRHVTSWNSAGERETEHVWLSDSVQKQLLAAYKEARKVGKIPLISLSKERLEEFISDIQGEKIKKGHGIVPVAPTIPALKIDIPKTSEGAYENEKFKGERSTIRRMTSMHGRRKSLTLDRIRSPLLRRESSSRLSTLVPEDESEGDRSVDVGRSRSVNSGRSRSNMPERPRSMVLERVLPPILKRETTSHITLLSIPGDGEDEIAGKLDAISEMDRAPLPTTPMANKVPAALPTTLEKMGTPSDGAPHPPSPESAVKHSYTFPEFLEVLMSGYGMDAQRPVNIKEKDLKRPISHYYINSSHNTYLEGNQLSSKSNADIYLDVLRQGCRCIEIDVWNGDVPSPSRSRSRAPSTDTNASFRMRKRVPSVTSLSSMVQGEIKNLRDGVNKRIQKSFVQQRSRSRSTSKHTGAQEPGGAPTLSPPATFTPVPSPLGLHTNSDPATRSPSPAPSAISTGTGRLRGLSCNSLTAPAGGGLAPTALLQELRSRSPFRGRSRSRSKSPRPSLGPAPVEPEVIQPNPAPSIKTRESGELVRSPDTLLIPQSSLAPPSPMPEPRVLHGHTLTSSISFRSVCKAVAKGAFEKSDLPIIISLEVHCDEEQQKAMVSIMKEEWGEYLLDKPLDVCDPDKRQPRLGELLRKILIKVKRHRPSPPSKDTKDTKGEKARGRSRGRRNTATSQSGARNSPMLSPELPTNLHGVSEDESEYDSDGDNSSVGPSRVHHPQGDTGDAPRKVKICKELGDLAIYTHSEHFKLDSFPGREVDRKPGHIYSVSEYMVLNQMEDHPRHSEALFAHNRNYFTRIYPGGGYRNGVKRCVISDNPDPARFWRHGCQMVALNWQTLDEGMMINHAMFDGEAGWVLKPTGYLGYDPSSTGPVVAQTIRVGMLDLSITVLAGQRLSAEGKGSKSTKNFNMAVECELHLNRTELVKKPGGKEVKTTIINDRDPRKSFNIETGSTAPSEKGAFPQGGIGLGVANTSGSDSGVECDEGGGNASKIYQTRSSAAPTSAFAGPMPTRNKSDTEPKMVNPRQYKSKTAQIRVTDSEFTCNERLRFNQIPGVVEELGFVRILVRRSRPSFMVDQPLWACIRLSRLRQGYRLICLRDNKMVTDSALLVLIEKKIAYDS